MKKQISKNESERFLPEGQVVAILERMEEKMDLMLENHVSLRDGLNDFKVETKNNFSAVFDYLSRIDDELSNIREELEKRKKTENIDKNWLEKIEQRLEKAEQQLKKQKLMAAK